jgi:D-alanine transaminase/branched-chain amino acid aminotransferase
MWAFLNNEFIDEQKAVLHASDLAIQRGYGIFDFFKVARSVPIFLDDHLDRFYFSAERMRLDIDYSKEDLKNILAELLQRNKATDTGVRMTLTGGYSPDGYQLVKPNLLITQRPFLKPTEEQLTKGIRLMSYEHQRQLPEVKSIDYLVAIWLQPLLKEKGADDVLYHQNGSVTECPRSNFFIITEDRKIITPRRNILNGVLRKKLVELAPTNFVVEERDLSFDEIRRAKEAFITSTTKPILPVSQIDQHTFPAVYDLSKVLRQTLLDLELVK